MLLPSSLPPVVESPLDPLSSPSSLVSLHAIEEAERVYKVECWDICTGRRYRIACENCQAIYFANTPILTFGELYIAKLPETI